MDIIDSLYIHKKTDIKLVSVFNVSKVLKIKIKIFYLFKIIYYALIIYKMEKYISIIWNEQDNIKYQDEIIKQIDENFQITYMFDMNIKSSDNIKFCNLFYYFHTWTYKPDRGFKTFKVICFNDYNPDIKNMKINQGWRDINMNTYKFKKEIRSKLNIDNAIIHISDNIAETIHNCSILYLFQENIFYKNNLSYTIRYENEKLKMRNVEKIVLSKLNENLFNEFIHSIKMSGLNLDDFCIDGSFILSILGIREARDLNFICLDNDLSFDNKELKNHKEILKDKKINYTKEEILYDPNNHFLFNGIKCLNLSIFKQFKINRMNLADKTSSDYEKDKNDIILIENYINKS